MSQIVYSKSNRLEQLACEAQSCTGCDLSKTRNKVVFGAGPARSSIMFIGEGPGEQEDQYGVPFIGRAGQLLTTLMDKAGINRDQVYITNVVKCRPPENRDPEMVERLSCRRFLDSQLDIIQPKVLVLVGRVAASAYLGRDVKITKERGIWLPPKSPGEPFTMIILHPSYLLRSRNDMDMLNTITDLIEIKRMDEEIYASYISSQAFLED